MSKAVKTVDLIKIGMLETTIHKPNVDFGFCTETWYCCFEEEEEEEGNDL